MRGDEEVAVVFEYRADSPLATSSQAKSYENQRFPRRRKDTEPRSTRKCCKLASGLHIGASASKNNEKLEMLMSAVKRHLNSSLVGQLYDKAGADKQSEHMWMKLDIERDRIKIVSFGRQECHLKQDKWRFRGEAFRLGQWCCA
ncbi:hypothetical protein Tco_0341119 [Tanacetum coccineum]